MKRRVLASLFFCIFFGAAEFTIARQAKAPANTRVAIPAESLKRLQDSYAAAGNAQFAADYAQALLLDRSNDCARDVLDRFKREARQRLDAYTIAVLQEKSTLSVPLQWTVDLKAGVFAAPLPPEVENR